MFCPIIKIIEKKLDEMDLHRLNREIRFENLMLKRIKIEDDEEYYD